MASSEVISASSEEPAREIDGLRIRLAEAERKLAEAQELIQAIQQGDVDAVVVSGPAGDRIFSLRDAEYGYRALVEAMSEGAATLAADGTVLYCNARLAHLLHVSLEKIIGGHVTRHLSDGTARVIEALLGRARQGKPITTGLDLQTAKGRNIPVQISLRELESVGNTAYCMVVTDLTESKTRDGIIAAGKLATLVLQSAAEAIAVCDATGKVIAGNRALEDLCGCNPLFQRLGEVLPLELTSGLKTSERYSLITEALSGVTFTSRKMNLRRDDGRMIPLLVSASPMWGEESISGYVFTLTDITERERALEALRESEKRERERADELAVLLESVPVSVFIARGVPYSHLSGNRLAEKILRQPSGSNLCLTGPEENRPKHFRILKDGRDLTLDELPARRAARGEQVKDFEFSFVFDDGEVRHVSAYANPLLDAQGRPSGTVAALIDITDRKQAEVALRRSQATLAAAMGSMTDGVLITDAEGNFVEINEAFAKIYKFKSKEECSKCFDEIASILDVFTLSGDPMPHEMWAVSSALRGESATAFEYKIQRKDTGEWWISSVSFGPIRDANGSIIGAAITTRDVTERKQIDEERRRSEKLAMQHQQLQALAKRLQKARDEERKMVARDLHDQIGQILTAIKFDMTWVARQLPESDDSVQKRLLASIELINDGIKSVRKICSGLRPGILDDAGLAAAIEWQANEFTSRTGIPCQLSLPSAALVLDSERATATFRIFQECLTNVARHAQAQAVRISLCTEEENLILVVGDDGNGFRESEIGDSLGVLGMKERAAEWGGKVQVSSSPGKGTRVTVRIPLHAASGESEDHEYPDRR